jgi:hypothetical protein
MLLECTRGIQPFAMDFRIEIPHVFNVLDLYSELLLCLKRKQRL